MLGLTETCTTISMIPPTQKIAPVGSAGQLIPGITARVFKADGTLAAEGEQGELVVTGPSMALGYLNNKSAYVGCSAFSGLIFKYPTRTQETFVDGWVRTGDEVIIKNGEVYVVDRLKVHSHITLSYLC